MVYLIFVVMFTAVLNLPSVLNYCNFYSIGINRHFSFLIISLQLLMKTKIEGRRGNDRKQVSRIRNIGEWQEQNTRTVVQICRKQGTTRLGGSTTLRDLKYDKKEKIQKYSNFPVYFDKSRRQINHRVACIIDIMCKVTKRLI